MPVPPVSDEVLKDAIEAMRKNGGNKAAAARDLGIPRPTLQGRIETAKLRFKLGEDLLPDGTATHTHTHTVIHPPSEDMPVEELIAWRKKQFEKKKAHKEAAKLIDIHIKTTGPIGIVHIGDPHVDDDGTDIALIEEHLKIIKDTKGMYAGNLGDLQNNWIGRLARLYAEQGTTHKQAWQLVEWMMTSVEWLYLVGGNHDAWSGQGDPLNWIMRNRNTAFQYHGARMNLMFPNKKEVRINARHDFNGHSMWNPAHGPMKAVQGGWRDHILTCGHKHTSFIGGPLKDPASGLLSWAIRCAGYKTFDRYAEDLGLPDQNAFPSAVTIINPIYADDDPRLIHVVPDVEQGADFLKFLRKKAGV